MRLLHTMLRVGNLQRSIDFYTKVLGMQLLRQSENPEYKYSLAFLGVEGGTPGQAEPPRAPLPPVAEDAGLAPADWLARIRERRDGGRRAKGARPKSP